MNPLAYDLALQACQGLDDAKRLADKGQARESLRLTGMAVQDARAALQMERQPVEYRIAVQEQENYTCIMQQSFSNAFEAEAWAEKSVNSRLPWRVTAMTDLKGGGDR